MNRDQRSSSRCTCPGPRGGPLVPARKQPELKAGAFSPAWLVPVAETGINGLYKSGLKAFFPPVGRCLVHVFLNVYEPVSSAKICFYILKNSIYLFVNVFVHVVAKKCLN
jgi:hypothetical protein